MGFRVQGLGIRDSGLGFRVRGFIGFRGSGFIGFRVAFGRTQTLNPKPLRTLGFWVAFGIN